MNPEHLPGAPATSWPETRSPAMRDDLAGHPNTPRSALASAGNAETKAIAVLGYRSALGAEVCRALAASGYEVRRAGGGPCEHRQRSPRRPDEVAPLGRAACPGSALVVVSELTLPVGALRSLRRRRQKRRLCRWADEVARLARGSGATTFVGLSSAFISGSQIHGQFGPSRAVKPPAETAGALAVEAAAERFSDLGGQSIVLRLGWPYGAGDRLTRHVIGAGSRGWQVLDGPPGTRVPTIEISDAAMAAVAALRAPAGSYDVTDGHSRTQQELTDAIAAGFGRELHPLCDRRWGNGRLFGQSRRLDVTAFRSITGWRPRVADAAEQFAELARTWRRASTRQWRRSRSPRRTPAEEWSGPSARSGNDRP
jgi:hypothetical protein